MKTLDEVIEAFRVCGHDDPEKCPYFDSWHWECCHSAVRSQVFDDALNYLKEFQGLSKMWNDKLDKEQENQPLTWEQLKRMEGKPVWVEQHHGDTKGWLLILRKCDDVVTCTTKHGNSFYLYKANYDEKWQAYRKERE